MWGSMANPPTARVAEFRHPVETPGLGRGRWGGPRTALRARQSPAGQRDRIPHLRGGIMVLLPLLLPAGWQGGCPAGASARPPGGSRRAGRWGITYLWGGWHERL